MQPAIAWLLLGLALIVVELLTGTFYLLIIGIAACAGSLVAWAGGEFWLQALTVAVVAVAGSIMVKRKKSVAGAPKDNQMDLGQSVVFEAWVNESQRIARVRYRGADWDAEIPGADRVEPGAMLFVDAVDGSRLKVSSRRPA